MDASLMSGSIDIMPNSREECSEGDEGVKEERSVRVRGQHVLHCATGSLVHSGERERANADRTRERTPTKEAPSPSATFLNIYRWDGRRHDGDQTADHGGPRAPQTPHESNPPE